jgi:hypothetical protein
LVWPRTPDQGAFVLRSLTPAAVFVARHDYWLEDSETYRQAIEALSISHPFEKILLISGNGSVVTAMRAAESCGNQSAHESPINRRLEASASCYAQPILLSPPPPRKECARPTCLTTDLRITKDSFDSTCFETDTEFGPKPVLLFSLTARTGLRDN